MKIMRKIIEIDEELCNGCGQCVPDCAEGALQVIDGKARMIAEKYCDGLGACLGSCPTGALRIVERRADDFDEAAVAEMLARRKEAEKPGKPPLPAPGAGGCPGSRLFAFHTTTPCQAANRPLAFSPAGGSAASELSHWPVQIRLVPPTAPFLKGADLLVAADCTAFAYPGFHQDFLKGRALLIGCPKFDDREGYIERFAEIFKTAVPRSITIVIMEVPCCGAMNGIIDEALKKSGRQIPVERITIGVRGELLGGFSHERHERTRN